MVRMLLTLGRNISWEPRIANDAEKANSTGQVVVSQEVCENKVRQKIVKRLSHYIDSC